MSRARRGCLAFVVLVLVALAGAGVLGWRALPGLAHEAATRALTQAGCTDVFVTVRRATPWRVELGPVLARRGAQLRAERVIVTFLPHRAARGQVDAIEVRGLSVDLDEPAALAAWPEVDLAALRSAVPAQRVAVTDATVTLPIAGREVRAEAAGTLLAEEEEGALLFDARARALGAQVRVQGTVAGSPANLEASAVCTGALGALRAWGPQRRGSDAADEHAAPPDESGAQVAREPGTLWARCWTAGGRLAFAAWWPVQAGLRLEAEGDLRPGEAGGAPVLDLRATTGPARLSKGGALKGLVPGLAAWEFDGPGEARAHVTGPLDALEANATVEAHGMDILHREWDLALREVRTTVPFRTLAPPTTDGRVDLTAGALYIGDVVLGPGEAAFTRAADGAVHVREAAFDWADGRLRVEDVAVPARAGGVRVRVQVDDVRLGQVLELLSGGRVQGEGRLSGWWTLTFAWAPEADIDFGPGRLAARPAQGWFGVRDPAALGAALSLPEAEGARGEILQKTKQALGDFAFDALEVEFSREPDGGYLTRIQTRGHGPRGEEPMEFGGVTFNIRDLDDLLRPMLLHSRAWKRGLEVRLNRKLERLAGGREEAAPAPPAQPAPAPARERADEPDTQKTAEDRAVERFFGP